MNTLIQISIKEQRRNVLTNPFPCSTSGLILMTLVLGCFAFSPAARAVFPAPGGGYPGYNTAEGDLALYSLTTGLQNTANGASALASLTTGSLNTANGSSALLSLTTGSQNTAHGSNALSSLTTGFNNAATGYNALYSNTDGRFNQ